MIPRDHYVVRNCCIKSVGVRTPKILFQYIHIIGSLYLGICATPVMEPSNKKSESQTCLHNEGEKFAYLTTGFHI